MAEIKRDPIMDAQQTQRKTTERDNTKFNLNQIAHIKLISYEAYLKLEAQNKELYEALLKLHNLLSANDFKYQADVINARHLITKVRKDYEAK
jgi:hypothetical protein